MRYIVIIFLLFCVGCKTVEPHKEVVDVYNPELYFSYEDMFNVKCEYYPSVGAEMKVVKRIYQE